MPVEPIAECYRHRCTRPGDATGRFVGACVEDAACFAQIVDQVRTTGVG